MSNNTPNDLKGLFDTTQLDGLDKEIEARLGRQSLVGKMRERNKAVQSNRLLDWKVEWRKYWYVYVFLIVSAIFTMTLGVYMGISPTIDRVIGLITYHTDIPHLLLALIYATAFVTVTEVAFVVGKWLFHIREEGNTTQQVTMLIMMVVAGISILGTGIAGGMVIASNISFLTDFVEIPDGAQKWVVVAIPVLITCYTFLVTAYGLSSSSAASERMIRERKREAELDHQTRLNSIEQIGREKLQVAELQQYLRLVESGKMSAAQAQAAIRAGRTLGQEETHQGRDIDGDGSVGSARMYGQPLREPAFQQARPMPQVQTQPRQYTLDELMRYMNSDRQTLVAHFKKFKDDNDAWAYARTNSLLPSDLTRRNFRALYAELMGNPQ